MTPALIWTTLAVVFLGVEMFFPAHIFLVLGVSAIVALFGSFFELDWLPQVLLFAAISALGSALLISSGTRRRHLKLDSKEASSQLVYVDAWPADGKPAVVRRGSALCPAKSAGDGSPSVGWHKVIEIKGDVLIVEKI